LVREFAFQLYVPAGSLSAMQRGVAGKRSRMRIKLEAVDKNGKLHKRTSVSRFYSHCVVIHFAAHPPSKFWPAGVAAFSTEWKGSRAMAELG